MQKYSDCTSTNADSLDSHNVLSTKMHQQQKGQHNGDEYNAGLIFWDRPNLQ